MEPKFKILKDCKLRCGTFLLTSEKNKQLTKLPINKLKGFKLAIIFLVELEFCQSYHIFFLFLPCVLIKRQLKHGIHKVIHLIEIQRVKLL
jgi:hypothetical protein